MSKKIKIGDDKQPAPLIQQNVPLFNLQTAQQLTDEGGTPLVSQEDTFLTTEASKNKSTSIVYTNDKEFKQQKNILLTGSGFSANQKTITVVNGDGLFTGINNYRIEFTKQSGSGNIDLSDGETITHTGNTGTATVGSIQLLSNQTSGFLVLQNFNGSGLSVGDTFTYTRTTSLGGMLVNNVINIEVLSFSFVGQSAELSIGDTLLLPTGLSGSTAVYETRTVTNITDNNTCTVSQNVTANKDRFGKLIKLRTVSTDPILKVKEDFAAFSEVSTTILGYPKAEEQLGLFSNVSTYGLDDDEFIFYNNDNFIHFNIWENRKNKIYGNHYRSRYREIKEESAISIESYRTPYNYPFGPRDGGYDQDSYKNFNTFVKIGAVLYDNYKTLYPDYAKNFLPYTPNHILLNNVSGNFDEGETVEITSEGNIVLGTVLYYKETEQVLHFNESVGYIRDNYSSDLTIRGRTSNATALISTQLTFSDDALFYSNLLTPLNPFYDTAEDLFAQIDTWTETWRRIKDDSFSGPTGTTFNATTVNSDSNIQKYISDNISVTDTLFNDSEPGYGTNRPTQAYLQSRKSFRYQPGRISGYTFGVKASNNKRDNNAILEWGIGNDTDDLVFQIRGSKFSIVRRSVVPLEPSILKANLLEESDQVQVTMNTGNNEIYSGLENKTAFETVIPRDNWNGDPLNGNGPSGWNWSAEQVTMYKIEFGWYGAIGVQFYAYVPVNNGEARWVKLHRLLIENQLGQPCMGDPYYKFKYSLIVNNHLNTNTPQFIYKYGTSCYIDGGDEGTVRVNSVTCDPKIAPLETVGGAEVSTSLVAIQPKTAILNSLGEIIKNKQQIYPRELSVSSTGLTEITLVKCKGCPEFGHTYQPNISVNYSGQERKFKFPPVGNTVLKNKLELKQITVVGNGASGQNTLEISNSDINFIRIGDVVTGDNIPSNTIITDIDSNTSRITLNNNITPLNIDSQNVTIIPVFLKKDLYSKIIASRIYLTYVKEFDETATSYVIAGETRYTTVNLGTVGSYEDTKNLKDILIERTIPDVYPQGSGIDKRLISYPTEFDGRLSQYNELAASTVPVNGVKNSLLFLSTDSRDSGSHSTSQICDYRIGITTLRPEQSGNDVVWYDSQGNQSQFDDSIKLYTDIFGEAISTDLDGYETGEDYDGRVRPLTVDRRIPSPPGSNSGRCAFLDIIVENALFESCTYVYGGSNFFAGSDFSTKYQEAGFVAADIATSYFVVSSSFGAISFNPENAEVGFNSNAPTSDTLVPTIGSGVFFASDIIQFVDSNGNTKFAIQLTGPLNAFSGTIQTDVDGESVIIWFVPVTLRSFRKEITKSFNFSPFPLYFFVESRDGASVRGAMIKETTQVLNSYNPKWVSTEGVTVDNIDLSVGPIGDLVTTSGSLDASPPNFIDKDRLSSALIDIQNQSQLRPYEVIDKLYVGQDTKNISLKNIFDFEKETITPDLLNTTAYFFLATSKETDPSNERSVQSTLTYIEQQ